MLRYFPTPMDCTIFIMVSLVQAIFTMSGTVLVDNDVPAPSSRSNMYSKHRPNKRPHRADTASELSSPTFFDRTKTPTDTLEGDESTSITARGIPITHSERSISRTMVTYATEACS